MKRLDETIALHLHGRSLTVVELWRGISYDTPQCPTADELRTYLQGTDSKFALKFDVSTHREVIIVRKAAGKPIPPRPAPESKLKSTPLHQPKPQQPTSPQPALPPLHEWQRMALNNWEGQAFRGIVQAITGTGKTRVAVEAIRHARELKKQVVVLLPTLELVAQWDRVLRQAFGARERIAHRDSSHKVESLLAVDILLTTVQSSASKGFPQLKEGALLVADEVHHLGANFWRKALDDRMEWRLGLSATPERSDSGTNLHLIPYFGKVCFNMSFRQAKDQNLIAPYRLFQWRLSFTSHERFEFDKLADDLSRIRRSLCLSEGLPIDTPVPEFLGWIQSWMSGPDHLKVTIQARTWMKKFQEKKHLMATAAGKNRAMDHLVPVFQRGVRTLVFCLYKDLAHDLCGRLRQKGIAAEAVDSDLKATERTLILNRFESHAVQVLLAPMVLDEGIDLPDAEMAVIVAGHRSERQVIQRVGRVLRRKADGSQAKVVFLAMNGTPEDPRSPDSLLVWRELEEQAATVHQLSDTSSGEDFLRLLDNQSPPPPTKVEISRPPAKVVVRVANKEPAIRDKNLSGGAEYHVVFVDDGS